MRAEAPERLRALADYLGASVFNVQGGQTWYIMHYGVGQAIEDQTVGHSSWDCLGRLAGVALWCERLGGHGCTPEELQAVVRCPFNVVRDGQVYILQLPSGIDGTTYAVLARMVKHEFDAEVTNILEGRDE